MGIPTQGARLDGDEYDALLTDLFNAAAHIEAEGDKALRSSDGKQAARLYAESRKLKLRYNGLISRHGGGPRAMGAI
jgi:hypothetical protein